MGAREWKLFGIAEQPPAGQFSRRTSATARGVVGRSFLPWTVRGQDALRNDGPKRRASRCCGPPPHRIERMNSNVPPAHTTIASKVARAGRGSEPGNRPPTWARRKGAPALPESFAPETLSLEDRISCDRR